MLSELFRIPVSLGGVPLLGLGVLLALWLVGFGVVMARHAARHGVDADFWGYAQPAVIGALVLLFAPRFAPEGIPIRGYGVMLLLAISVGVAMAVHRARRHGIAPDTIFALVFWLFVAGIAGARSFFVIEYWDERYAGRPLGETIVDVLQFTEGGLVVYGSVIGGLVAFVWFVRRHGLPLRGMADILAPCFMAGLALGRLGCLLNGCCYGGPCDLPWAVTFPADSPPFMDQLVHGKLHGADLVETEKGIALRREDDGRLELIDSINGTPVDSLVDAATPLINAFVAGEQVTFDLSDAERTTAPSSQSYPPAARQRSLPVHPTQVYSSVNAALTAWLLWVWFPHRRRDGEVALLMFTLYPISRFLLEVIRTDESAIFGTGLSISQNVSLVALALATVGWVLLLRTPPGRRLEEVPLPASPGGRTRAATAA
ncbi:Prolipoprotein diacylglyceryl transferase [Botrimarina colliarenosi]|uniref:Phosphatidylglycerol--prolipoprotein diacylglyceryl transferase n=1 Tax=Botrimarina colliarenosi TaxID=2528001 RepID=A0A5C6AAV3_9BACT|nr:prolipoprotein diacylglyceryl transferase [Botrimarina colliarenosi]TWT96699.1 Prolipoprotein diacylglyceryl transferase [Botrimarina colliarenosi]